MNKKAIDIYGKKPKLFKKKFVLSIFALCILMIVLAYFIAAKITDNYKEIENIEFSTDRWDSDTKLVDDRLPENYPISFVISPVIIGEIQSANILVVYNDGKYISELFTYESYDSFQEQLNSNTAFFEQLKTGYSDFDGSDWAYISSTDISPSDLRDTYLEQYTIDDFAVNTQVNMMTQEQNSFFIFGVMYDDDLNPSVHMYYGQSANSKTLISSEKGQKMLTELTGILIQDSDKVLNQ